MNISYNIHQGYVVDDIMFSVEDMNKFGAVIMRIQDSSTIEEAMERCKDICSFYKITKIDTKEGL